jgi:predicted metal-dependent phosphoesterase TrpH
MRGVLHVHSIFSDGEESLERIVQRFQDVHMDFLLMSDHAEVFDDERMKRYAGLCETLSSAKFPVIPGLEFALKGGSIHILGYGITGRVRASTMDGIVDGIHEQGGIAVLAHPPSGSINMIDTVKGKLDGIEVWNGRYDGTTTPRAQSFQLLRRVRTWNSKTSAFCGVDFHKIGQARKAVHVELEAERAGPRDIISALRAGRFTVCGNRMKIPASGSLTFVQELLIAVRQPLCRPWLG